MTLPLGEVTPGHRGGRREHLNHVADIANIPAHQNARSVNDPPSFRNSSRFTGPSPNRGSSRTPFQQADLDRAKKKTPFGEDERE